MSKHIYLLFCFCIFLSAQTFAQANFIHTKEGKLILDRKKLIINCLNSLHKDKNDETALSICECQMDKIDGHFTNKQYKNHTNSGIIDITDLIKEDSIFEKEIQKCYTGSGKTVLMQAEGFENEFISACIENIQKNTEKKLDYTRLADFCSCQQKKLQTLK